MYNKQLLIDRADTVRAIINHSLESDGAGELAAGLVQAELDELACESLEYWTREPAGVESGPNVPACLTATFHVLTERVMRARGRGVRKRRREGGA